MSLFSYILYDNTIFTLTIIKTTSYLIYYSGYYLYNKKNNKQQEKINELYNEIIELNKIITELKEQTDTEFEIITESSI